VSPFDPSSLDDPERWVQRILEHAEKYEFATFQVASSLPKGRRCEEMDTAKRRLNVAVGRRLEELWPGREVDFRDPNIRFVLLPAKDWVSFNPTALFIYGRYVKNCRDIPQAVWHCQACHGAGCSRCEGTGHRYDMTVEEAVTTPLVERTGARESRMHGAGREDVDARMLGRGRPFVVSLVGPRRRTIDFDAAIADVPLVSDGKVAVTEFRVVKRPMVRVVTQARAEKSYRARFESVDDLPLDFAERMAAIELPIDLAQQTPTRVLRRRSDLTRKRRILELSAVRLDDRHGEIELRTEAGTYVKEFVSGDGDRTLPSLTSILGIPCVVTELDVLEVDFDPFG